ncbi:MAG: amino-acid N-acetyltransferase [Nitrospirota bacterium]|nr:amino-acid N-acetyltransferase [Nitrospirota bacterium]
MPTTPPADATALPELFRAWQERRARETGSRPSQEDLARAVGATQGAISQFLHGRTRIGAEMALRLAAVLEVHPSLLRPDLPFPTPGAALAPVAEGGVAESGFVGFFRSASPYINAHRNSVFVVHLPGEAVQSPLFPALIHDLALLASLGVRLVVVHGVRPQLSERLSAAGLSPRIPGRLRPTPAEAVPLLAEVTGLVRTQIEAMFSTGLPNSPMAGARVRISSGNFVTARPLGIHEGVDYGHTGTVRRVDTEAVRARLADHSLVLISPLGFSATGEVFNLSALEVAAHVAGALSADKLLVLTEQAPLRDAAGNPKREIALTEAEALLVAGHLDDATAEALQFAVLSLQQGVRRCHLLGRTTDGALMQELFTRDGCGTLVTVNRFEEMRTAGIDDVGGVLELIAPLENAGILVRRSRERLEMEIGDFLVMERDGTVVGCAALHPFPDERMGELACLAIHPDYRRSGRAAELLLRVEREARERGLERLFVLTTQTAHWFIEHGFSACAPEILPVARLSLYNYRRGSRVYQKWLGRELP